ncbi:hypothetical protein IB394_005007 [Escherichia coli]|jgi:hypothetical protein|nr:hypothetical protein [Escherichia coli]EFH6853864.1 hypothetical protein [Escherichia coli]EFI8984595.1 hypothetical protein [Escherichia coli]EFK8814359.1 hypothetical protein [Escherichia coli]EFU2737979.1 hypothetical protein [Escherichia coli]EGF1751192.1 hypothetical protein [Escherichia coli]
MRKNKGRLTYYLEMIDEKYHFEKKISSYSKEYTEGKTKTTKRTLSELVFNENEVGAIDFTKNGLRPVDKNILLTMMKEYKESET